MAGQVAIARVLIPHATPDTLTDAFVAAAGLCNPILASDLLPHARPESRVPAACVAIEKGHAAVWRQVLASVPPDVSVVPALAAALRTSRHAPLALLLPRLSSAEVTHTVSEVLTAMPWLAPSLDAYTRHLPVDALRALPPETLAPLARTRARLTAADLDQAMVPSVSPSSRPRM